MTKPDASAAVVIVGGGLAGLPMACILGAAGIDTILIDAVSAQTMLQQGHDIRTTAISSGSAKVLDRAQIWDSVLKLGCPINRIDISDGASPILLDFKKEEAGDTPFGWIFDNLDLRRSLYDKLDTLKKHVTLLAPASVVDFEPEADHIDTILSDGRRIRSQLVIGADGRNSFARQYMDPPTRGWKYGQRAIVCLVTHEHPHNNVALENFRPDGPFAVLPFTDLNAPDENGFIHRSAVVWTEDNPADQSLARLDDDTFAMGLAARFPSCYGKVALSGHKAAFELVLQHAGSYIGDRMVLIAEAAHAMHPIAGQGLNVSLRDVDALADLLIAHSGDYGDQTLLERYERKRRADTTAMLAATDTLNKLFGTDSLPVTLARRAGLKIVSRLPIAKRFFMRQAMGD
jgi:2-octaprenyl-6-methoxyphenol hydroxylase